MRLSVSPDQSRARASVERWNLPRFGIDGADGGAGDVSILQRLDVEIKILDRTQAVGQGAQQFGKLAGLGLRLGHADRP